MNSRLYSLVTILTAEGDISDPTYELPQVTTGCRTENHQHHHCTHRFSNVSDGDDEFEGTKVARFSQRSLWCCFLLFIPVVIPFLIYIKDSNFTRQIFLGFFVVVLITIGFSLMFCMTKEAETGKEIEEQTNGVEELTQAETQFDSLRASDSQLRSNNCCPCQMTPRVSLASPIPSATDITRLSNEIYQNDTQIINGDSVSEMLSHNNPLTFSLVKDSPPPYYVAVNLPSPCPQESPPPSYERAAK